MRKRVVVSQHGDRLFGRPYMHPRLDFTPMQVRLEGSYLQRRRNQGTQLVSTRKTKTQRRKQRRKQVRLITVWQIHVTKEDMKEGRIPDPVFVREYCVT